MANESTAYEKYKAELLGIPIDDDDELMSSERPTEIEPFEDISNTSTPYEEYKARLLQGSVITEKQPLDQPQIVPNDADPGPQIPRADPVDDPLGATSAVTSTDNMGLTKATSGATLKTELREDGYYSDIVADVYNEVILQKKN
jgi:hypothetical protein